MRKSHGFTLVELLVVIGIIALLIAILLPSLNKARQSAQRVACMSNLKQLHIAIVQYSNDYRGLYPFEMVYPGYPTTFTPIGQSDTRLPGRNFATSVGSSGWYTSWMDSVYPYVRQLGVYSCPSRSDRGVSLSYPSYGYSTFFSGIGWFYFKSVWPPRYTKISDVRRPHETIMLMDYEHPMGVRANPVDYQNFLLNAPVGTLEAGGVHQGYGNILFADGHGESIRRRISEQRYFEGLWQNRYWNGFLP